MDVKSLPLTFVKIDLTCKLLDSLTQGWLCYLISNSGFFNLSKNGTLFLKMLAWGPFVCDYVISQSSGRCCLCS